MYQKFALALVLVGLTGCGKFSGPRGDASRRGGSEEFKSSLRRGAGAARPAALEVGASLGLTANQEGIVHLSIDPASLAWAWVTFDTTKVPVIAADASLADWARAYIGTHSSELGLKPTELVSFDRSTFSPMDHLAFVTFQRSYASLPVKGAFVQMIFSRDAQGQHRLREIINNSYGEIEVTGESSSPNPQDAIAATGVRSLENVGSQAVIHASLNAQGQYSFRYATEFQLKDASEGELFNVTFDNDTMAVLEAYSNRMDARHEIMIGAYNRSYALKDEELRPFALGSVRLTPTGTPIDVDANGIVNVDAAQVTVSLVGSKSAAGVVDLTVANATDFYSFTVNLPAQGGITKVPLAQADAAALNAFVAVHDITEYAKRFLDPAKAPLLTTGIQANVNLNDTQNLFCNAYFDGQTLNFLRAGNGCGNTALINDVIYHEWGHALDNVTGIVTNPNGITDSAFSEGLGDIIASYKTGSSIVGLGIELNDPASSVRNVQNVRKNPPANNAEAEVHSAGQIIGGSFWDLRKSLVAMLGPKEGADKAAQMLFTHMTMTDRFLDSYQSLLRIDDTDANPATRSPLYCTINKAFALHNLTAGVTEGDACVDADQGLRVRVEVDNGDGLLTLSAASWLASKIVACPGKVTACSSSAPGYIEFVSDANNPAVIAAAPMSKRLFKSSANVTTKAGEPMTFVGLDTAGKVVGMRTIQFKTRDQTTDLSKKLR